MPANPRLNGNRRLKEGGGGFRDRWIMLAVLTTARLAMGFQFQSVGSASPFLIADLGIDYASVGFLIGLYLPPTITHTPTLVFGPKVHNPDAPKNLPVGGYIGWVRVK